MYLRNLPIVSGERVVNLNYETYLLIKDLNSLDRLINRKEYVENLLSKSSYEAISFDKVFGAIILLVFIPAAISCLSFSDCTHNKYIFIIIISLLCVNIVYIIIFICCFSIHPIKFSRISNELYQIEIDTNNLQDMLEMHCLTYNASRLQLMVAGDVIDLIKNIFQNITNDYEQIIKKLKIQEYSVISRIKLSNWSNFIFIFNLFMSLAIIVSIFKSDTICEPYRSNIVQEVYTIAILAFEIIIFFLSWMIYNPFVDDFRDKTFYHNNIIDIAQEKYVRLVI